MSSEATGRPVPVAPRAAGPVPTAPLPEEEYHRIFSRVPRLTVEVLIVSASRGVLLGLRDVEPCKGTWSLPGGTVRFGEPLTEAVRRVAADELGLEVTVGELCGYIEYPSHYEHGLDSPVGLVFEARACGDPPRASGWGWFAVLPEDMHDEQKEFLRRSAAVR